MEIFLRPVDVLSERRKVRYNMKKITILAEGSEKIRAIYDEIISWVLDEGQKKADEILSRSESLDAYTIKDKISMEIEVCLDEKELSQLDSDYLNDGLGESWCWHEIEAGRVEGCLWDPFMHWWEELCAYKEIYPGDFAFSYLDGILTVVVGFIYVYDGGNGHDCLDEDYAKSIYDRYIGVSLPTRNVIDSVSESERIELTERFSLSGLGRFEDEDEDEYDY